MSAATKMAGSRLRPLIAAAAGILVLALAGCGEKSEPAVHPPTTASTTATVPTGPTPPATTAPQPTPTAPVPKTTP